MTGFSLIDLRARISADGSSYEREMGKVASTSQRTGRVIREDADKSTASMDRMSHAGGRMRGSLSNIAGYVGVVGVAFGLKDIVQAGMKAQDTMTQLTGTMKNLHLYSKSAVEGLQSSAEGLSEHGGADVELQLPALQRFITMTGSVTEAKRADIEATNLAHASNLGFAQAVQYVSMGLTGSVGRLKKYVGVIEPVTSAVKALTEQHGLNMMALQEQSIRMGKAGPMWLRQQELLSGITSAQMAAAKAADAHATGLETLARIQQVDGNATKRYAGTAEGAANTLTNSFHNVMRTAGEGLLPVITRLFKFLVAHKSTVVGLAFAVTGLALAWGVAKVAALTWAGANAIATGALSAYAWMTRMAVTGTNALTDSMIGQGMMADRLMQVDGYLGASYQYVAASATEAAGALSALPTIEEVLAGGTLAAAEAQFALAGAMDLVPVAAVPAAEATGALGLAMDALPIFGLITAFVLLQVGIVELVKHWTWVKHELTTGMDWVLGYAKKHWKLLLAIMLFPFIMLPILALKHIGAIVSVVKKMAGAIGRAAQGMWDGIGKAFKPQIDYIIKQWNRIPEPLRKVLGWDAKGMLKIAEYGSGYGEAKGLYSIATGHMPHFATGGILGGYGGGDKIPFMGERGEGVMRKESVRSIGTNTFNAINATGKLPPSSSADEVFVSAPINVYAGQRVIAETTVHFVARRQSLNGSLVLQ